MDTKTFLQTVLGDDGWYCVFGAKNGKVKQKFYEAQKHVITVGEQFAAADHDAYFALATFIEPNSRKTENVAQLRSFFIDLDCGQGKEYSDQQEALSALKVFCQLKGFPKPLLVDSGYGIHAYWPLSAPISASEWVPVAEGFKRLCLSSGLRIDPAVTADPARLLRIPNTYNYKKENQAPRVSILGNGCDAVDFEMFKKRVGDIKQVSVSSVLFEDTITVPSSHDNAMLNILIGNTQSRFKKIVEKTAKGKGCLQILSLIKNQEDAPEPLWRAGLSVAKFCVDGEKAIHLISRNYSGYSEKETEYKSSQIKGPYLCKKFDSLNPGVCGDCPNKGKIKSPIVLGKEVIEATDEDLIAQNVAIEEEPAPLLPTGTIPSYPNPYFRGKQGGVYVRSTDSDGEVDERVVYHNDLYVTRRIKDPELGECLVIRLHLPKDGIREFLLPMTSATSKEEFRKELSRQGVAVLKMDDIMGYIASWVNDLQSRSIADDARTQFGWTKDMKSFILGENEYMVDRTGINHPSSATAQFFPAFEPKGTLEGWKEVAAFYNQRGLEFHQFMIGAGFGSVLMEFLPNINAAMLHIYSEDSGFGKTTLKYAMASIWGNYEELVLTKDDTRNFTMNRAEVYKNLPICIDEVTNMKPEALSDIAMTVTGGKQRGRLSSSVNRERQRGDRWSTLFVTSANASFIEKISKIKNAPQAEAQRVLEKRVQKFHAADKMQTDEFNKLLAENYGHAGPIFVKYVLENIEEVRATLFKVQSTADKAFELDHQNRFWSAFVAVSLTGALIAKKLGLINYNSKLLFEEARQLIKENRESVKIISKDVFETLNDYINENWNNILKIKSTEDRRSKETGESLDSLISPTAQPRIRMVARYETDVKKLFLVPKPLKHWCIDQQINYSAFQEDLINMMGGEQKKIRLGKGTHMNMPAVSVLVIDCSGFIDELEIEINED